MTDDADKARTVLEDAIESAYWDFDALRKRKGRPMSERDAFKQVVRSLVSDERDALAVLIQRAARDSEYIPIWEREHG